ncbi:dihydrolipoyl dehydrogenase [Agrococcus sp. ARC_14]|uniref:dihydrolipoyl dehydrogenase n=1 Tax=Agrococcus sp. ARC_14 TaxID=2919927 RepID=UPI001F055ABC|nr:dihydrolipoyl dehydrogenase [Agrococcus sp. ARC_14]MCH1883928.1 dihydrolipoyl dehydrogenase [Agrococcus sp. ARC_14]
MERFDVVVLGAGPGGYTAAVRAAQLGKRVAIVEPSMWGGVCLNLGCVPAKTLLRHAEIADIITRERARFGLRGEMTADYGVAYARSREVADGRVKGVHYLMRKHGIEEIHGTGRFRDAQTIEVTGVEGVRSTLRFGDAIIATGARPMGLPGIALSERVISYETLIMRADAPTSIVIIGGGAIGVEFASLLAAFGTQVTIVEAMPRLLPNEDDDVAAALEKQLAKRGITVLTSARVAGVDERDGGVRVAVAREDGESELAAELVLVAIGFAPNSGALGLEAAGVRISERGGIEIDERMRTSAGHIWAIGDVTGKLQLAHVAEAQGIVAAESIAGVETVPIADYRMMPRAVFGRPQVASFGLTERDARATGQRIVVSTFPFMANARAHALGEPEGFVKLIADEEHGMLLGAHLIGPDVSELLPELTLAQQYELSAAELARNVHTHPTLSEVILEAAHGVHGSPINL